MIGAGWKALAGGVETRRRRRRGMREGGWGGRWGGDGERVRGGRVGKAERRHGGHLWMRMGCRGSGSLEQHNTYSKKQKS